jgi:hypothetical protein
MCNWNEQTNKKKTSRSISLDLREKKNKEQRSIQCILIWIIWSGSRKTPIPNDKGKNLNLMLRLTWRVDLISTLLSNQQFSGAALKWSSLWKPKESRVTEWKIQHECWNIFIRTARGYLENSMNIAILSTESWIISIKVRFKGNRISITKSKKKDCYRWSNGELQS